MWETLRVTRQRKRVRGTFFVFIPQQKYLFCVKHRKHQFNVILPHFGKNSCEKNQSYSFTFHCPQCVWNESVVVTAFVVVNEGTGRRRQINEKNKRKRERTNERKNVQLKVKSEITYLFMYFICTEKCELLHLAARTHVKWKTHINSMCLDVDSLLPFYVCICFFPRDHSLQKKLLCTISIRAHTRKFYPFIVAWNWYFIHFAAMNWWYIANVCKMNK